MRIVTLNTWKNEGDYPRRLGLMAAELRKLAPDVVCLQECFAGEGADTAARLAGELGLLATTASARTKLRAHEGRQVLSSSGLAILSRTRPSAHASLRLPSDERDGERVALSVDLAGEGLRVLNLHLTHLRGSGELRAEQLAAALAWARLDWPGAALVCGDLNCARGDAEFALLDTAAGEELGATLHARRGGEDAPPGRAIDHGVLVQAGRLSVRRRFLALGEADAWGRHPSDHRAVVVDLDGSP